MDCKNNHTREKLICEAIEAAISRGIKIRCGAVFDWTNRPDSVILEESEANETRNKLPSACNAFGAIELVIGRSRPEERGFTEKACEYLNVGTYWLYRFHIGFDRSYQLIRKVQNEDKKWVDKEDEVAKLGIKIRKKYIKH